MYVNELIKTREGKHNDENFRLPTPKHWGKRDDHIHIQRRILKKTDIMKKEELDPTKDTKARMETFSMFK